MATTYWRIGERIFEQEQRGGERVDFGERIVGQLTRDLSARLGRGFSRANVFQMRQFYPTYRAKIQAVSGLFDVPFPLSWSRYVRLLTVTDNAAAAGQSGTWIAKSQPRRTNGCVESRATRFIRRDLSGRLRHVEYSLSDSGGFAVLQLINTLTEWGSQYASLLSKPEATCNSSRSIAFGLRGRESSPLQI